MRVNSKVPKGSALLPLLLLFSTNDLTKNLDVNVRLSADDYIIYGVIYEEGDKIALNIDSNEIAAWCNNWQMTSNFDRTVFMSNKKGN